MPHFVSQRGYEGSSAFGSPADYRLYLSLASKAFIERGVKTWAWALMENSVSFVLEPSGEDSLARALGETHRRYARISNARREESGKLWHSRFNSFPFEEALLTEGIKIIEFLPVAEGLTKSPLEYNWSSAAHRVSGAPDPLETPEKVPGVEDLEEFFSEPPAEDRAALFSAHLKTGRPLGSEEFILKLENRWGKRLRPLKRGRKPKKPS
ncbi:MAG: transposase [Deltaproteobacteria bacterium]|nr:MAG: transposase [Deltaproteobacteria bacterium]